MQKIEKGLRVALYEPEIPQNTGALMRLSACLGVPLDIIEPCGFPFSPYRLQRTVMDYLHHVSYMRHENWTCFHKASQGRRLILLTPKASENYINFSYTALDTLILGKESVGFPKAWEEAHSEFLKVKIPMNPQCRSLNVSLSAALVVGEALRQTQGFPQEDFITNRAL